MKEDKKWAQQLRDRMEGYSEPLPPRLWEEIEKGLDASAGDASREVPKVVPMWRRWQAAAAVAVLAVVTSVTVWLANTHWNTSEEQTPWTAEMSLPASEHVQESVPESADEAGELIPRQVIGQVAQRTVRMSAVVSPVSSEAFTAGEEAVVRRLDEQPVAKVASVSAENYDVQHPAEDRMMDHRKRDRQDTWEAQRKTNQERFRQNASLLAWETSGTDRKWQVGLNAGNSPYTSSSNFGGISRLLSRSDKQTANDLAMNSMADNKVAYTQVLFNNRNHAPETNLHHRMPVTVGATVSYQFNDRWSLESGLTYTLLSSELRSGAQSYIEEEQKLHYVGIPLKAKYTVWKNKLLTLYAVAGGAAEKCVSGRLETAYVTGASDRKTESQSLDVDELQWSVNAAIGGQLNLTKQLGVYVEPGVSYYFDDGSDVETFRKEHPCMFNLQVGIRLGLSK